jgi:hypothetical protein
MRNAGVEHKLLKALSDGLPVRAACGLAGIGEQALRSWRADDPQFNQRCELAEARAIEADMAVLREARSGGTLTRARTGIILGYGTSVAPPFACARSERPTPRPSDGSPPLPSLTLRSRSWREVAAFFSSARSALVPRSICQPAKTAKPGPEIARTRGCLCAPRPTWPRLPLRRPAPR